MTELETQILHAVQRHCGISRDRLLKGIDAKFAVMTIYVTAYNLAGRGYLSYRNEYFSLTDKGRAALQGESK